MTPSRCIPLLTAAAAASILTVSSWGAVGQPPPRPLERVDQGIGDVEPLGVSLRDMQVDLRRPASFDSVFRFDRVDAFGRSETVFMRMDGGITAVFPQSVYEPSQWGLVPAIPPGTTFYIGDLPPQLRPPAEPRPQPAQRLDLSISAHAAVETPRAVVAGAPRPAARAPAVQQRTFGSIWTDDAYRTRRIASLLDVEPLPAEAPEPRGR